MISQVVRVHAALLAVSLIYGCFYVILKILFKSVSPSELIMLRFLLTALLVTGLDQFVLKHPPPQREDLPLICKLGLTGVFLVQILVAVGLYFTTAFHSALIMATIPIFTLIISVFKGHEQFQSRKLAGVVIAFIGVMVLLLFSATPAAPLPPQYLLGDAIVMLNAIAFAWFLVSSQTLLTKYRAFSFMAYCYIVSAGLFSIIYFGGSQILHHNFGLDFLTRLNLTQWSMVAYVVLFASISSYTLNNYALKRTSPTIVAIYIFLQPVISAAAAYYCLGEHFTPGMGIAAALTLAGLLLASMNHQANSPAVPVGEPFALDSTETPTSSQADEG
jgi:drug/metabolite transporter (DMT)-like permease